MKALILVSGAALAVRAISATQSATEPAMTKQPDTDAIELPPCCECGAPCSVQTFEGPHIQGVATIWICSAHRFLGGNCPSETAYLSEQAWSQALSSSDSRGGV